MNSAGRQAIDAERWPRVARIPEGRFLAKRAQLMERSFSKICENNGIELVESGELSGESFIARAGSEAGSAIDVGRVKSSDDNVENAEASSVTFSVIDPVFFTRLADSEWLGLGEAYLAGEWASDDLPELLARLLNAEIDIASIGPIARSLVTFARSRSRLDAPDMAGELPTSLLELYAGELLMGGSGLFASGVRTSSREEVSNHARGAGKAGIPSHWMVDVTYVDAPKSVSRADLIHAQVRNIDHLLDMARVRAGDRVAEWPSAGGELALRAAERGAGAEVITVSDDHTDTVTERVEEAGLRGAVDVVQMDRNIPSPREFESDFEAIINIGRLETFGRAGALRWLQSAERLLVERGTIAVQMVVATDKFDAAAERSLDLVRAYVWPQLQLFTMEELHKMVDRDTGLRIVAEEYIPAHFATTLQLQRDLFAAHAREAAGIGYDRVFRRLWGYYLSLFEALIRAEKITLVQVELTHAPRRAR
ncbi:MAG: class I SAM-dependent methyltransferase [Corynebacterium sp.]|uniref:class I SAM-dependent methyltransferase n=1 Tax=Corynebacterium sp. TaxID=1720 RepID=UPI0026DBB4A9|nr:class I SAM-dependent methyltransferase [Corynebacterium sp.]MDO5029010.1 class I SAM-dependent methyltransferase [Corynebacterium sp.]